MGADTGSGLDARDWAILTELQRDGRLPVAELGRRTGLSQEDATERLRRLELTGVITGFHASVDPVRVGLPVLAVVRVENPTHRHQQMDRLVADRHEIVECLWLAAESCYLVRVVASSAYHLEELASLLAQVGAAATSVVSSVRLRGRGIDTPVERRYR